MLTTTTGFATVVLLLALAAPAPAAQIVFGKKLLIRNPPSGPATNRVVHVAKDAAIAVGAAGGAGDPQCSGASGGGGSIQITASGGAGDVTIPLPCGGWTTNASNTTYRYTDPSGATCQRVIVRAGAVTKAVCTGAHVAIAVGAGMAPLSVVTTLNTEEYVTQWAGEIVADGSDGIKFLAKNAPPPLHTTSTLAPATTTSSTTTTTLASGCCGGQGFLAFTATSTPGDCGDATNSNGLLFGDLDCGALYLGGGAGGGQYSPVLLPDTGTSVFEIAACTGQTATLAPTTSEQTGSLRTCTGVGCLVGAPIPVVSELVSETSPPVPTCGVLTIAAPVAGSVDCATGQLSLTTSLQLRVGDVTGFVSRPCALCWQGTCIGGPNDGLACTPGTTPLSDSYPTSHDCPPDPSPVVDVSLLSASLTTVDTTWEAVPSGAHQRTFCGFCRDANISGEFESPPRQCLMNGMTVGAPCVEPFESCEQRNQGAFGPGGGLVKTVTVTGAPAATTLNDLAPHDATLASLFCVAPANDLYTDAFLDLPGPGAFAIPGAMQLCASAHACP